MMKLLKSNRSLIGGIITIIALIVVGIIQVNKNTQVLPTVDGDECTLERQLYVKYINLAKLADQASTENEKTEYNRLAAKYCYLWAKLNEEKGYPDRAQRLYKKALEHDPSNMAARQALGQD